jgi:hypothetical protein
MLAVVVTAAMLGRSAGGQQTTPATTQPAAEPWPRAVEQFARALVAGDDVRPLLADGAVVRPFGAASGSGTTAEMNRMLGQSHTATLIGAHAYVPPPVVWAADVAVDCKNSLDLPDELRQRMVPQDDVEIKRANATAVQWLSNTLGAADGDLVGVVVMYVPAEPLAGSSTPPENLSGEMMFVLLKGQAVQDGASDDDVDETAVSVRQVVYGNPLTMR